MYEKLAESLKLGLFRSKNLKSGFLPFNFKEDKNLNLL
jgi:hypothetical protein